MKIINVFRCKFKRSDWPNIGDLVSSPFDYYCPVPDEADRLDIQEDDLSQIPDTTPVVFGGGGLLYFAEKIVRFLQRRRSAPTIGWGIGHNTHEESKVDYNGFPTQRFALLGVRDFGQGIEWVPCASCKHTMFDQVPPATEEVVVYEHNDHPIDFPAVKYKLDNKGSDLGRVIAHLQCGETILTTSYHGAYWGTLLGRRIVVPKPFSTKFFAMKHPPEFCAPAEIHSAMKRARAYPEALGECRLANDQFCEKVGNLLADAS